MDFELSEEQLCFQQTARDFSIGELAPHEARWDAEAIFPTNVIAKAGELGFCSLYTPEEVGGLGLSQLDATIVFEELARGCTSTTAYLTLHNMVSWMIANWATAAVKQAWCGKLASGQKLGSHCLTELGAGSDAASLETSAELIDGHYVINGTKAFMSGAGAHGVSAFVVPADAAGISYGRKEEKMGWNSEPTCTISFDSVRIPTYHLLSQESEGFRLAMRGLDGGRINIATCSVSTAQAALDAKDPSATTYCAMAKRFATDIGFQICNEAQQIHGGYDYIREYPLERHFRDVRVHQILEGTN